MVKAETGFSRKVLALLSRLQNAAMENGFGVVRFNLQGNVSAKLELNLSHCFRPVAYIQAISQFQFFKMFYSFPPHSCAYQQHEAGIHSFALEKRLSLATLQTFTLFEMTGTPCI